MKTPFLRFHTLSMALLVLAGLAPARSAAGQAGGQAQSCTANAGVPAVVNVERITALASDLVVTCTGGTPTASGAPVPVANFQIFANTSVTSRFTGTNLSDAVLLIDEPFPAAPVPDTVSPPPGSGTQLVGVLPLASPVLGTGSGVGTFSGAPGRPNVFQGVATTANSVLWQGVPVDPPGPAATRTYRFRNIWVNASSLGLSGTPIPTQVVFFVSVTPASIAPINNPQQTVAFIQSGMASSVITPATFPANVSQNPGLVGNPSGSGIAQLTVRLQELFSTVFQRRNYAVPPDSDASPNPVSQNVPGFVYSTETGFFDQSLLGGVGLADAGTRLRLDFENVSAGVSLFLPTVVPLTGGAASTTLPYPGVSAPTGTGAGAMLRLISSEVGPFTPVAGTATLTPGGAAAQLAITGGTATAVYEVLNSDAAAIETADIPVGIAFAAGNIPLGTTTVTAYFAPISAVTTSSSSAPIPRFVDLSSPLTAFGVVLGATPTPTAIPTLTPTRAAGPAAPIPVLSSGMLAAMGLLLFASGWLLLRR
jgi:hypothetical protein